MPKDEVTKKKMVVVEEVVEQPDEVKKEEVVDDTQIEKAQEVQTPEVVETTEPVAEETEKTNYLWIIVPTALLVGALAGGLITYFSGLSSLEGNSVPTPTSVATEMPKVDEEVEEEKETDEFDRSAVKLQVLNGSGVAGLAGKAKTMLEGLGYKSVAVGNASTSDFTDTVISVKASKKELLDFLVKDLSKDYQVSDETETLSASSAYDFVITLGNK